MKWKAILVIALFAAAPLTCLVGCSSTSDNSPYGIRGNGSSQATYPKDAWHSRQENGQYNSQNNY